MDKVIEEFLSQEKSLLVAPAGYGKTYTIVQCVNESEGKSLILTHTHAGVAALKNALKEQQIDKKCYEIETITSYAQKYVKAYCAEILPDITDNNYWVFILEKAESIFKNAHIKDVIKQTYSQLFVDEYQDCTISQHKAILAISESIPTHILGDPLQGIMDFNKEADPLVSFYNDDLKDFTRTSSLTVPYRWQKEGNNSSLGEYLVDVREKLLSNLEKNENNDIDLTIQENPIKFIQTTGSAYDYTGLNSETNIINRQNNFKYTYCQIIRCLLENRNKKDDYESLLIISKPPYKKGKTQVEIRAELKSRLYYPQLYLLEAIDEPGLYELTQIADKIIENGFKENVELLYELLVKLYNKTEINNWINNNSYKLIKKVKPEDKKKSDALYSIIEELNSTRNPIKLCNILEYFNTELGAKCNRIEFFHNILNAMQTTEQGNSIYKQMVEQRNKFRRIGRKVGGKCIGTVALTKGLEFDTVIILDADMFNDSKELYVAMTRACKNLLIFSQNSVLKPYKKNKKN